MSYYTDVHFDYKLQAGDRLCNMTFHMSGKLTSPWTVAPMKEMLQTYYTYTLDELVKDFPSLVGALSYVDSHIAHLLDSFVEFTIDNVSFRKDNNSIIISSFNYSTQKFERFFIEHSEENINKLIGVLKTKRNCLLDLCNEVIRAANEQIASTVITISKLEEIVKARTEGNE